MKNNELQNNTPDTSSYSVVNDISLIDFALILIKRKRLITIIISLFILIGIIAALLVAKKFTYSTTLEIGSQVINGSVTHFESTQTLLAKLQHNYIPIALNKQRLTETSNNLKYKIQAKIPLGSNILVLETKGTENQAALLKGLLSSIAQLAITDHIRIYDSVKQSINSRLKVASTELKRLEQNNNNETEIAIQYATIERYSSQLANLLNTREIQPPIKSLEPTSMNNIIIIITALLTGLLAGVFLAFFAEFASRVKDAQLNN